MPKTVTRATTPASAARERYHKIATRTKADDPRHYTKNPHAYGDELISGGKLGGALQRDIVYWIARHTIGAVTPNRKEPDTIVRPEWAKLSITQLARLCQVWDDDAEKLRPVERKSIAVAVADLETRGIIEARDRKGCGKTVAKMYRLTPERWKEAKPYKPPTPKQLADAESEILDEDDDDQDDDQQHLPDAGDPVNVDPGRRSRPQQVPLQLRRDAAPVTIRLVYHAGGFEQPITFRARTGRNGRLEITAAPHVSYGCAQPQRSAVSSPSKPAVTVDTEQVKAYKSFLREFCLNAWGKVADEALVSSVISSSRGAPLPYFTARVHEKFSKRNRHTSGILSNLASDAAEAWRAVKASQAATGDPTGEAIEWWHHLTPEEQAACNKAVDNHDAEAQDRFIRLGTDRAKGQAARA